MDWCPGPVRFCSTSIARDGARRAEWSTATRGPRVHPGLGNAAGWALPSLLPPQPRLEHRLFQEVPPLGSLTPAAQGLGSQSLDRGPRPEPGLTWQVAIVLHVHNNPMQLAFVYARGGTPLKVQGCIGHV